MEFGKMERDKMELLQNGTEQNGTATKWNSCSIGARLHYFSLL